MAEVKTLRFLALGSLLGLALLAAPACSGQPGTLCDLQCECEHCNDVEEDVTCEAYATQRDVSEIYDCLAEWEDWANCVEEKGTCNEDEASFSTHEQGSCTGPAQASGSPCANNDECTQSWGDAFYCSGGTCQARTCTGDQGGYTCATSDECPDGEDRCGDEAADLAECIDDASDMGQTFG